MNATNKKRGTKQAGGVHDPGSSHDLEPPKRENALSMLMTSARRRRQQQQEEELNKKRRRPGGSFVACPVAGCGKMILDSLINVHLDRCVRQSEEGSGQRRCPSSNPAANRTAMSGDEDSHLNLAVPVPGRNPLFSSYNGDPWFPSHSHATPESKADGNGATQDGSSASPLSSHCVTQEASGTTPSERSSSSCRSQRDSSCLPTEACSSDNSSELDTIRSSLDSTSAEQSICKNASLSECALISRCGNASIASSSTFRNVDANDGATECRTTKEAFEPSPTAPFTQSAGPRRRRVSVNVSAGAPNAFSIMMEKAKILSSKHYRASGPATAAPASLDPIQQCLYLSVDGQTVSLFDAAVSSARYPVHHHHYPIAWSAAVILKDRAVDVVPPVSDEASSKHPFRPTRRPVELTIATGMPPSACDSYGMERLTSAPSPASSRWVRHHSRLSVPVLKSILQKSIRRRRPLPSVRVAMELADKSLGDLLRRLPVIVMEDSTLHPDLGFLVWLMVAHSKDYAVPRALMARVFQIVFETASCQWKDDEKAWNPRGGPAFTTSVADPSHPQDLSLNALHAMTADSDGSLATTSGTCPSELLVWCLLVRADYGGMRCDVEMLHRFANLWQVRFRSSGVPANLLRRWGLLPQAFHSGEGQPDPRALASQGASWSDIPSLLHERAKSRSSERVAPLASAGIQSLAIDDVCVEGVDFHCSPIVDHLLALPVAGLCRDLLLLTSDPEESGENRAVMTVEDALKYCLWHYSSGVNHRQPLIAHRLPSDQGTSAASQSSLSMSKAQPRHEEMWKQLIAVEASRYQVGFVRDRLPRAGHS